MKQRFGSRYERGGDTVKRDIVLFAAGKLLNADPGTLELSINQKLACLSERMPIEFHDTSYIHQRGESKQVESHLRFCLKIDSTLQTMTTTCCSEPLLSRSGVCHHEKATI